MLIAEKHIALRRKGQEKKFFEVTELLIRSGYETTKDDIVSVEFKIDSENKDPMSDNIKQLVKYYIETIILHPEAYSQFYESLSKLENTFNFKIDIKTKFTEEKIKKILEDIYNNKRK